MEILCDELKIRRSQPLVQLSFYVEKMRARVAGSRRPKTRSRTKNLSLAEQLWICNQKARDPSLTRDRLSAMVAVEFKRKPPSRATITRVLKTHHKLKQLEATNYVMLRTKKAALRLEAFDSILAQWVITRERSCVCVSGELIKEKARQILAALGHDGALLLGTGWIHSFKKRHKLRSFKLFGEALDVDLEAVEQARPELLKLTSQYASRDIFNADESGLFYSVAPTKTIARARFSSRKKAKERLTILFAVNADGSEKRKPLIIGTAARPRCFKFKSLNQVGFYYANSKKAWMNRVNFTRWLLDFDQEMRDQDRHVLLLVDCASCHKVAPTPTNVKLHFLPKNTTAKMQSLDAGVIAVFKTRYKSQQVKKASRLDELGCSNIFKVDVRKAMEMVHHAWNDVSAKSVANCWKHCNFVHAYAVDSVPDSFSSLIISP